MKLKNKIFYIILGLFLALIVLSPTSNAGTQKLNNLNFDVKLNSDGSARIKEIWDIYISSTNTLFKTFEVDKTKYSNITDVSVYRLNGNERIALTPQINYEYHVTKDYYYALMNSDNDFEIAWGVGLDNSSDTRTYIIEYTVTDAVKKYQDCTEFYWMFLNSSNGIPAEKVTGIISLPQPVSDIENLRVWAHGPLNGEIERTNNEKVSFYINNLGSETMLETRIAVLENNVFSDIYQTIPQNKFETILKEETKWANEANLKRNSIKLMYFGLIVIYIIILLFFLKKILKYNKEYHELKLNNNITIPNYQYFRDIPREKNSTPAEAAYLYYMNPKNDYKVNFNTPNVLSAILMNLYLKKVIEIEPEDKKNFIIHINEKDIDLSKEEQEIIELLRKISKSSGKLSTKEMQKYANTHYTSFLSTVNNLESIAESSHIKIGNLDTKKRKLVEEYKNRKNGYSILTIISLFAIPFVSFYIIPLILEFLVCNYILNKCGKTINILTENGSEEIAEWKGLQKYMKDYSLIKDREVFEVVLWEKFLVYATAFGIADKVLKQLKIAYPEISDSAFATNSEYQRLYIISNTNYSFVNAINSAYNSGVSARNIANSSSSSGSGYGGGFSGGGGGGGGRRKYGWKII